MAVAALSSGLEALRRGEWAAARAAFEAAASDGSPEAYEGLGMAAWWTDEGDVMFPAWEKAYRGYRAAGDALGAARVAAILASSSLLFRGEWAVARGWFARAHRLIDDMPPAPEHVRLAICEGLVALSVSQDPSTAVECARRAEEVAQALSSVDLELQALALEGVALVRLGAVSEGMRLLDEATAAALAGEIADLDAVWLTCCFLLFACEHVRDYDRAGQWCERISEFAQRWQMAYAISVCRTHYATVLTWKGSWNDAERELEAAGATMQQGRAASAGEAWARLGELRRRQGRYADARRFYEQAPFTPIARIGLAALAFDEGDAGSAVDTGLRVLTSLRREDLVTRSSALEVLVRAAAACGRLDEARIWLAELEDDARSLGTDPALAGAAWARGVLRLAEADAGDATFALERAVVGFDHSGGVFEAASARLDLAAALEASGDASAARAVAQQAKAALAALRTTGASDTRWAGLTDREVDVLRLIVNGMSNRAIAGELHVSDHTVKRHVANILTKTGLPTRAAVAAEATRMGI